MNVGVYFPDVPQEIGGGYTFGTNIFQSLLTQSRESHHNFIFFIDHGTKIPSVPNSMVKKVVVPPPTILERISGRPSKNSRFESIVQENEIELMVYCDAFSCYADLNIPYITFVWDLQHRLQPWFPEVSAHGEWERREAYFRNTLQKATYIITGTRSGQKEISMFFNIPENRIVVLPHPTPGFALGNPDIGSREQIGKKYGIYHDYLLYPAQFWPHKNHINALLALKIMKDEYRLPFDMVFVGSDAGNLSYVKKFSSGLGLDNVVHYPGFVPRDDLITLYKGAFSLIYLSFFGPENLPPLEAFALRCPVIAANVPGAGEQLEGAALLVDPRDPGMIASTVKKLHEDPSLQRHLIEKGYSRAQKWTGTDLVRELITLLDGFEHTRRCWK